MIAFVGNAIGILASFVAAALTVMGLRGALKQPGTDPEWR
jgi:hypothetical protein